MLSRAIGKILNHPVTVYGAGRTDSGVHAMAQVINFNTNKAIELMSLARGVNSLLPPDIRVKDVGEAEPGFHARYSAKTKTYVYVILNTLYGSPFLERYVWHIPYRLNVPSMNSTARLLMGEHDFSAFKKKNEVYKSPIRKILRAGVKRKGGIIYCVMEANGFLRYMVRNIVGTLVLVGSGKITPQEFMAVLEMGKREKAGVTAPARGLFLRKIKY